MLLKQTILAVNDHVAQMERKLAPVAASQRQKVMELDRQIAKSAMTGESVGTAMWKDSESVRMQDWLENNQ